MKPSPSCALSQSRKPLGDGLRRHSAAPVPAHWSAWENLCKGFVPLPRVWNPFPGTDSAPAHPLQTQTHRNNQTSAASSGCLFPNQAQTSSKQEQMSCLWVPTCPMVCITRNMTLPPGKLPKTLLSHNLNVSIPLQAGVHHFPGADGGAGAFPGGAGCFDFPSW